MANPYRKPYRNDSLSQSEEKIILDVKTSLDLYRDRRVSRRDTLLFLSNILPVTLDNCDARALTRIVAQWKIPKCDIKRDGLGLHCCNPRCVTGESSTRKRKQHRMSQRGHIHVLSPSQYIDFVANITQLNEDFRVTRSRVLGTDPRGVETEDDDDDDTVRVQRDANANRDLRTNRDANASRDLNANRDANASRDLNANRDASGDRTNHDDSSPIPPVDCETDQEPVDPIKKARRSTADTDNVASPDSSNVGSPLSNGKHVETVDVARMAALQPLFQVVSLEQVGHVDNAAANIDPRRAFDNALMQHVAVIDLVGKLLVHHDKLTALLPKFTECIYLLKRLQDKGELVKNLDIIGQNFISAERGVNPVQSTVVPSTPLAESVDL